MREPGHLGRLLDSYKDSLPFQVSDASIARAVGVSSSAYGNWRHGDKFPTRDSLAAIVRVTGLPYRTVLNAALRDAGYKVEEPSEQPPHTAAG